MKKKRGLTKMLARMLPVPSSASRVPNEADKGKRVSRFAGDVLKQCGTCKSALAVALREAGDGLGERLRRERNYDRRHGTVVDHQVAIYAGLGREELFRQCQAVDPCVGTLIEYLDQEGLIGFASQTPIYCSEIDCATAVDLFATDRATRSRLVLFELKSTCAMTGDAVREYEATHGVMTRGALQGLPLSYLTRHRAQLLSMREMIRRQLGLRVDDAQLLRLAPGVVHTYNSSSVIDARADALFAAMRKNMMQRARRRQRLAKQGK